MLPSPSVRIVLHRTDRYGITAVAPQVKDYVFSYAGSRRVGSHREYSFSTEPRSQELPAFRANGVVIDDRRYLPSTVRFAIVARGMKADGTLTYAPFERYWMIVEAAVTARSTIARVPSRAQP